MKFLDWILRFAPWLQPVIGISALVVAAMGPIPRDAYDVFMGDNPKFLAGFVSHQRMEERLERGGSLWEFVTSLVAAVTEQWQYFLLTLGLVVLLAWVVQWRRATGPPAPGDVIARPFYERRRERRLTPRLAYVSMLAVLLAFSASYFLTLDDAYAVPKSLNSIADHLQCPVQLRDEGPLTDDPARALYSQLHGVRPGLRRPPLPDPNQIAAAEDYFEHLARVTVWSLLGLISVYGVISRLHRESSVLTYSAAVGVLLIVTAGIQAAQWFGLADAFGRLKLGARVLHAAAAHYRKECETKSKECSSKWPFLPPPPLDEWTAGTSALPEWSLSADPRIVNLKWLWPLDGHDVKLCLTEMDGRRECPQTRALDCLPATGLRFVIDPRRAAALSMRLPQPVAPQPVEVALTVNGDQVFYEERDVIP